MGGLGQGAGHAANDMVDSTARALVTTLSPVAENRVAAEAFLAQLALQDKFVPIMLAVLNKEQPGSECMRAALLVLKNHVKKCWPEGNTLDQGLCDRQRLRNSHCFILGLDSERPLSAMDRASLRQSLVPLLVNERADDFTQRVVAEVGGLARTV